MEFGASRRVAQHYCNEICSIPALALFFFAALSG
jgi:hypothetical protein